MEKCWTIEEHLPIKVDIMPSTWTGRIRIKVPEMKMTYFTAQMLGDNLTTEAIEYGEGIGYIYPQFVKDHANSVQLCSYHYQNGEAEFFADTAECVDRWINKHKDIITK